MKDGWKICRRTQFLSSYWVPVLCWCTRRKPDYTQTPITAMGCWQCLPLSVVWLKGRYCQKPHCRDEVVDTSEQSQLKAWIIDIDIPYFRIPFPQKLFFFGFGNPKVTVHKAKGTSLCGWYSREEPIQEQKLYETIRYFFCLIYNELNARIFNPNPTGFYS